MAISSLCDPVEESLWNAFRCGVVAASFGAENDDIPMMECCCRYNGLVFIDPV